MTRTSRRLSLLALLLGAGLSTGAGLQAGQILDPAGDLRQFDPNAPCSSAGRQNSGLDALSATVIFDPNQNALTFASSMAGPIAGLLDPTTGANQGLFSWGINHCYGNLNFNQLGLPNVLF